MLVIKTGSSTSKINISCFVHRGGDNQVTIAVVCIVLRRRHGSAHYRVIVQRNPNMDFDELCNTGAIKSLQSMYSLLF